jgi:hypothetical protein
MGQDLMIPEDPFGLGAISGDPAICELYRCRKLFYYNGNVWGYFQASGQQDAIGYFDRSVGVNGRWVVSLLPE